MADILEGSKRLTIFALKCMYNQIADPTDSVVPTVVSIAKHYPQYFLSIVREFYDTKQIQTSNIRT